MANKKIAGINNIAISNYSGAVGQFSMVSLCE
jgi:hypothetical protein